MGRFTITFILFMILSFSLIAQIKILGRIIDAKTNESLEYVNVSLMRSDSTFVKGVETNENGIFVFNDVHVRNYILYVTYLGYNKSYISVTNTENNIDLGDILLYKSDVNLNEVTVTGNSVLYKADRQLIMPNENQIKASNNGLKLLANLHLSRIEIDPLTKDVKLMGDKEVQLRINGVLVTKDEIAALNPTDIVRVEYHDDPGMRYGDVGAVINFITQVKKSGGNLSLDFDECFTGIDFANDNFSGKVNHKKSEFSLNGYWHRRNTGWTRENIETFNFPTEKLIRTEKGEPTKYKENSLNLSLNYVLHETDKYLFNVRLRYRDEHVPNGSYDRNAIMHSSDSSKPLNIVDHSTWESDSPSLDLYFQKNLKNDQLIMFNVVGTYIDSRTTHFYAEYQEESLLNDIYSDIHGDKYSLITEGIYEKGIGKNKISAGMKHTQTYTNNQYKGNIESDISMNTAVTYTVAEYQFKRSKFNYTLGLGMMRTYNSQEEKSKKKYILRPKVRITYSVCDNAFVRYSGYISGYAPSLSDLNDVEQDMNTLEKKRGNPDLRTVVFYTNELTVGFNKGIFNGEFLARYSYDRKPIMEQITFEKNIFVHSKANQKAFHRISLLSSLKTKIWGDNLILSLNPRFCRYVSEGNNYSHNYNIWRISSGLDFNYKGWMTSFYIQTRWNDFTGETLNRGERCHTFSLGYNAQKWSFSLWIFNPFSKEYSLENINRSALAPKFSRVHTHDLGQGRLTVASLSINLDFGRQFKSGNKRLNNDDSDAGIMK